MSPDAGATPPVPPSMPTVRPVTQLTSDQLRLANGFHMAFAMWREARGESYEGKIAIGYAIMNRVERPKWWGNTVDTVIDKPMQFSSMTDPNDQQLRTYPGSITTDTKWLECIQAALDVLDRRIPNPVPTADSYYATWMDAKGMTPPWAKAPTTRFVRQIGNHKFFDTDGEHPDNKKVA